jgi:hypothetical protein
MKQGAHERNERERTSCWIGAGEESFSREKLENRRIACSYMKARLSKKEEQRKRKQKKAIIREARKQKRRDRGRHRRELG